MNPRRTASALIHYLFSQAFNQGDLTVIDAVMAVDGVTRTLSSGVTTGRIGFKHLIASIRTAFPDVHWTIENEIAEGDQLAAYLTMRGTHRGTFLGHRPTGRAVDVQGTIFARIEHGQLVEGWMLMDRLGLLQQLGVVPPPRDIQR